MSGQHIDTAPSCTDSRDLASLARRLNLDVGSAQGYLRWTDLAVPERIAKQMAQHASLSPGMDCLTQASLFLNRLSDDVMEVVAWLDLFGYSLIDVRPAALKVRHCWTSVEKDGEMRPILYYRSQLPMPVRSRSSLSAAQLGSQLVALWQGLIAAIAQHSGLGRGAQWRLITDALAAAYLEIGKEAGCEERAMTRAADIVTAAGKPLSNRQWCFKRYEVPAQQSPTGEDLAGWFRVRGGCCRLYTLEDNHYCGTCVLLKEEERQHRFSRALRLRASARVMTFDATKASLDSRIELS